MNANSLSKFQTADSLPKLGGNTSKEAYNRSKIEMVEEVLANLTPELESFSGSVYPAKDVTSDQRLLEEFKNTPNFKKINERSDAKLLEKTFIDMVETEDWFGEDALYGDDPGYRALVTFPTTEIDDTFNHIDVIAVIKNETTNYAALPFAVDLTYNTAREKIQSKFQWKHVYGKKKSIPAEVSEFGESFTEQSWSGESVITKPLAIKHRNGLKLPGFTTAKYFEDNDRPDDQVLPKGRIKLMPRFVVGYAPEIADKLAEGRPNSAFLRQFGEKLYNERKKEFDMAEKYAKWGTLFECAKQADDIKQMLESLSEAETKYMKPEELMVAKAQISVISSYFDKALDLALDKAENDPVETATKNYAKRDAVLNAIIMQSYETFIEKNWRNSDKYSGKNSKKPKNMVTPAA